MRKLRWLGLIAALVLMAGALMPAAAGVHFGGIYVSGGYGYYSGPDWPGYYWAGYYPPPFFGGWYGPWYPYAPVYMNPQWDKGQVNLQVADKSAQIYLDGAYAGKASAMKKFWLAPGVYQLQVRSNGQKIQEKRIYVLTGKTLKVNLE